MYIDGARIFVTYRPYYSRGTLYYGASVGAHASIHWTERLPFMLTPSGSQTYRGSTFSLMYGSKRSAMYTWRDTSFSPSVKIYVD